MDNLLILTQAATEAPEAVEETFNLIEWVTENSAFVNVCLALVVIVTGAVCYLAKRKRK